MDQRSENILDFLVELAPMFQKLITLDYMIGIDIKLTLSLMIRSLVLLIMINNRSVEKGVLYELYD